IPAAPVATPPNPKTAATSATIRKIRAHFNMVAFPPKSSPAVPSRERDHERPAAHTRGVPGCQSLWPPGFKARLVPERRLSPALFPRSSAPEGLEQQEL